MSQPMFREPGEQTEDDSHSTAPSRSRSPAAPPPSLATQSEAGSFAIPPPPAPSLASAESPKLDPVSTPADTIAQAVAALSLGSSHESDAVSDKTEHAEGVREHSDWAEDAFYHMERAFLSVWRLAEDDRQREPETSIEHHFLRRMEGFRSRIPGLDLIMKHYYQQQPEAVARRVELAGNSIADAPADRECMLQDLEMINDRLKRHFEGASAGKQQERVAEPKADVEAKGKTGHDGE